MDARSVTVVGAGIGGLTAALLLSACGHRVTVVEKEHVAGGKIRQLDAGGAGVDAGPTVFTMRWLFDALLASIGESLDEHLVLTPAQILARHHWRDGTVFDLSADQDVTKQAITAMAGQREADAYRDFCKRTAEVFSTLDHPFMRNPSPSPAGLALGAGVAGLPALTRIRAFSSLWQVIGEYFRDPRLRQLFGRYATYCGASPFEAPGPLMLIAHVEQRGVWLVKGGMAALPAMMQRLCIARGVDFRFDQGVERIETSGGRVTGVALRGKTIATDAVIFNGDPSALFSGLLGGAVRKSVPAWQPRDRSLSAVTVALKGRATGFPLSHHTVFFSDRYRDEFEAIAEGRLPDDPTLYVCAQDRGASPSSPEPQGAERLFFLVNAPPLADTRPLGHDDIARCLKRSWERLAQAGLTIDEQQASRTVTTPADFATLSPATGGALYGRASKGWRASFQRPGARTAIKGLYLAGGAVHPGAGVPMAALSGSHAAQALMTDLASTAR